MQNPDDFTLTLDSPSKTRSAQIEAFVERLAWLLGAAALATALAGYLGPGPRAQRNSNTSDRSLAATYCAVERYEAPAVLSVWYELPHDVESVRLAVSRSFADHITPENITPRPATVEFAGDQVAYTFHAREKTASGFVTFRFQHNKYGWRRYWLRLEGHDALEITQLVLP